MLREPSKDDMALVSSEHLDRIGLATTGQRKCRFLWSVVELTRFDYDLMTLTIDQTSFPVHDT